MCCLLLFLFTGVVSVTADTVCIALHLPAEASAEVVIPGNIISAFEGGIMEPFFDAYHIVFNVRDTGDFSLEDSELERNGVDYVISVDLSFALPEEGHGVLIARYTLTRLESTRTIVTGGCSSEEYEHPGGPDSEDLYELQGRAAAEEMLNMIKRT